MASKQRKGSVSTTGTGSKSPGSGDGKKPKAEKKQADVELLRKENELLKKENSTLRANLDPKVFEQQYVESTLYYQEFVRLEQQLKRFETGTTESPGDTAVKENKDSKIRELELHLQTIKSKLKQSNEETQRKINIINEKEDSIKRLEKEIQSLKSCTESNNDAIVNKLKQELADSKAEIISLSKETNDMRKKKIADLEKEIKGLKDQLKNAQSKMEKLNEDKQHLSEASQQVTKLASENATLKEEIESCQKEKDYLNKQIAELSTGNLDLKQFEEERNKLNKDTAKFKQDIKKLNDENETLRKKNEDLMQTESINTKLQQEILGHKKRTEEQTKETETLMQKIADLESKNLNLQEDISEYKSTIKELETKITDLEKALLEKKKEFDDLNKRLNETSKSASKEGSNKTDDEIENLRKQVKDLTKTKEDQEAKIAELKNTCHEAFAKITQKEKEMKKMDDDNKKIVERKEDTINKLRKEIVGMSHGVPGKDANLEKLRKAEDEISELKNRLSKVVGAKLADDNPNITDLSDINRPTKLSEKYSELYDNEWTDAFEECEDGRSETESIRILYKMLDDSNSFCQKLSEKYIENIKRTLFSLPGNVKAIDEKIDVTRRKQLKEISKSFAPYLVEEVSKAYLNERKQNPKPNTLKYLKKCLEICWLMNVQDPPVFLDTSEPKQGAFDSDRFRTYTKSGKTFDFVVWPPLLLHSNGPLLCKGVAQAK